VLYGYSNRHLPGNATADCDRIATQLIAGT
jgi:hypothetical protein